jgi:hypothetical protein
MRGAGARSIDLSTRVVKIQLGRSYTCRDAGRLVDDWPAQTRRRGPAVAHSSATDSPSALRRRLSCHQLVHRGLDTPVADSPTTSTLQLSFIYMRTRYQTRSVSVWQFNLQSRPRSHIQPPRVYITIIGIGFGFVCCLFASVEVVRLGTKRPTLSPGSTAGIASLLPGKRLMLEVCLLMKRYA